MATTTNYGWTTPDDTALVKDGASAIRTLGSSIDTTTKALNPSTTLGDIEYRSSTANTNTRLGIGTTGQILTVSGGVPAWATPAGGGGMTLLSTTTLSGASTTVSSISGSYKDLLIHVSGMQTAANSYGVHFDPNGNASSVFGARVKSASTTASADYINNTGLWVNRTGDYAGSSTDNAFTIIVYNYASSDPIKNFMAAMAWTNGSSQTETSNTMGGIFTSSAISSWKVSTDASSFNAGTIKIYGVN